MYWGIKWPQRLKQPEGRLNIWHLVYAWRPHRTLDECWVWLQPVWRRVADWGNTKIHWEYSLSTPSRRWQIKHNLELIDDAVDNVKPQVFCAVCLTPLPLKSTFCDLCRKAILAFRSLADASDEKPPSST